MRGANPLVWDALLALVLSDKLGAGAAPSDGPRDPRMEAYREQVRGSVMSSVRSAGDGRVQ